MFMNTVGPDGAMVDVFQASADDENAQVWMQLYDGNDELLAEVKVDSDTSMCQLTASLRSLDSSTEATLRAWQERIRPNLRDSERDMIWALKDNYTKMMLTGLVKQLIYKTQQSVVLHGSVGKERRANAVAEQLRSSLWSKSADCQHLVYLLLSRSRDQRLSQILAVEVASFLMVSRKDAFFGAAAAQNGIDYSLQTAVIEFLAARRPWARLRVVELEADPQVAAAMAHVLPDAVTLVEWLARRMPQSIELEGNDSSAIMHITAHAEPLIISAYYRLLTSTVRLTRRNNAWTNKRAPYSETIPIGSVLALIRYTAKGRHQ